MATYQIRGGRLLADGTDIGVTVRYRAGVATVFRRNGKGIASYGAGTHWSTAVMRFGRDHLNDRYAGVMVYDSRENVAP